MKLTTSQAHVIFETRLQTSRPTWEQVSDILCISPYQLRQARRTREYLDEAWHFLARRGFSTHIVMLRIVGCLHPDITEMPALPENPNRHETEADGFVIFDDGGRAEWENTHREGPIGDCVPRAVAIALNRDYGQVWEELQLLQRKKIGVDYSVDDGVYAGVSHAYLKSQGWKRLQIKVSTPLWPEMLMRKLGGHQPFIIEVYRHFFAVAGGQARDVWNATWRRVVAFWIPKSLYRTARLQLGDYLYAERKAK